jgi:hypothetical protein
MLPHTSPSLPVCRGDARLAGSSRDPQQRDPEQCVGHDRMVLQHCDLLARRSATYIAIYVSIQYELLHVKTSCTSSTYLTHLPKINLPHLSYLPSYLSSFLPSYLPIHLSTYLSNFLSAYLLIYLPTCLPPFSLRSSHGQSSHHSDHRHGCLLLPTLLCSTHDGALPHHLDALSHPQHCRT